MSKKIILLVALEEEFPKKLVPKGVNVYYTHCGKVNVAIAATRALSKIKSKNVLVVNYGTAGSAKHKIGALLKVTQFRQADIDASGLGFPKGVTPLDKKFFKFNTEKINFGPGETCYTADNLQNFPLEDMESYSIAKVCKIYGLKFVSYKFITNNFNKNAAADWKNNVKKGAKIFLDKLLKL
ncbi:MAG: 5'-methylthioadenosine nucleosidase [Patescibacteria group bacterium]|nr:5'-methylthioadenosine nucleosidase [Patescibacteria group bacterium]MDD5121218.1 5'-methylthioadenosine nucleosidase [Patescibacteria group bacterium]MDD5221753.1 5'-methylthioadenosine nucleosidase [Patescibacteria group bacterium]MDD5395863.1 5'-methylthioadenosine nucleosidase [Patescibacteria group bacterium]